MQLKLTNLASVSRKKETDTNKHFKGDLEMPVSSNNIKDLDKMIVMSGTAKRKSFQKILTTRDPLNVIKNQYRENFLKLREPFYKTRQRQNQHEEKLMNKSCEMLFEYLKPYKNIQTIKGKHSHEREWNKTVGSILKTTNVVYQKTATRKVEILSIFEKNSNFIHKDTSIFDFLPNDNLLFDCNHYNFEKNEKLEAPDDFQVKEKFDSLQKTISSEDFVTNAFPGPGISYT